MSLETPASSGTRVATEEDGNSNNNGGCNKSSSSSSVSLRAGRKRKEISSDAGNPRNPSPLTWLQHNCHCVVTRAAASGLQISWILGRGRERGERRERERERRGQSNSCCSSYSNNVSSSENYTDTHTRWGCCCGSRSAARPHSLLKKIRTFPFRSRRLLSAVFLEILEAILSSFCMMRIQFDLR